MTQKDIHKGGRPKLVRPKGFHESLLREYETMTVGQMAASHKVTRQTISRWLRTARTGGYSEKEETKMDNTTTYRVCVTKYGYADIEAANNDDALKAAEKLPDSAFDWGEAGDAEIVETFF